MASKMEELAEQEGVAMTRTVALSALANEFEVSVATVEDALEELMLEEVGPTPRPAGRDAEYIASEPDTDTLVWFRTALKLARRLMPDTPGFAPPIPADPIGQSEPVE